MPPLICGLGTFNLYPLYSKIKSEPGSATRTNEWGWPQREGEDKKEGGREGGKKRGSWREEGRESDGN